jgi:hypothetical protein
MKLLNRLQAMLLVLSQGATAFVAADLATAALAASHRAR